MMGNQANVGRQPLHEAQNSTESNAKNNLKESLNARLADGIDLALAVKQAHWTLKGPQFIGLHLMLDGFRDKLDDYNDMVAERITQLGGTPFGTATSVAAASQLKPYPLDAYKIADHLSALIDRFAVYANSVRKNIGDADEAVDAGTSDLLTEISRGVDKQLWFLEAHVCEPTGHIRVGDHSGRR